MYKIHIHDARYNLNFVHGIHLWLRSLANHSKTIAFRSDGGEEVKPGVHNSSKKNLSS
jgi:hypothetical protein